MRRRYQSKDTVQAGTNELSEVPDDVRRLRRAVRKIRFLQVSSYVSAVTMVVLILAVAVAQRHEALRLGQAIRAAAGMMLLVALVCTFASGIASRVSLDALRRGRLVEAAADTRDPRALPPLLSLLNWFRVPFIEENVLSGAARLLPISIASHGGRLPADIAARLAKAAGNTRSESGAAGRAFQLAVLDAWRAQAAPADWRTVRYLRAAGNSADVRKAAARCAVAVWGPDR